MVVISPTLIQSYAARPASLVIASSKTSFILAGDNMGPSKLEKANKLGVAIIGEEEFLKMIEGKSTF